MKENSVIKREFDDIKHKDKSGEEFWYARELQNLLGYNDWEEFADVIKKAQVACELSHRQVADHFVEIEKQYLNENGQIEPQTDYVLSRSAAYFVVMNGDRFRDGVLAGQKYFSIQGIPNKKNKVKKKRKRLFPKMSEDNKFLLALFLWILSK